VTIKKFPHHPESIPDEMLLGACFVTCDEEKVPLIPIPSGTILMASSTDPDTWRYYPVALETYEQNAHVTGVGRVLTIDDPYVGVDLDKCLYPETGKIEPWALRIIEELDSYSEISPSGCGIKIWVKVPGFTRSYKKAQVEIYSRGRYFTVTGTPLPGTRSTVEYREAELNAIIDREFSKVERDNSYGSRSGKLRSSFNLPLTLKTC
jgi:primase-polymerase (primpol)-like protein